jgi:hypothetical protein
MKGFLEFKGYRTRIIYDPIGKEFLAHRVEYPDFDVGDAAVKPTSPIRSELVVQKTHLETLRESHANPCKQSKVKTRMRRSAHSPAIMPS